MEHSTATASPPYPKGDAAAPTSYVSFSRLALDDADSPSSAPPQADTSLCIQPQQLATSDELTAAPKQSPASDVPDNYGAPHSATQQSAASLCTDHQSSLGTLVCAQVAALPAVRVETTGMMKTIPVQQGDHIRFGTTDTESDSESMPARPDGPRGPAKPHQTPPCQLNSIDQQAVVAVAADAAEPDQALDNRDACCSSAPHNLDTVTDTLFGVAMQGIMATTVVTPAASQQAPAPDDRASATADDMPSGLNGAANSRDAPQQAAMPDALAASAPAQINRASHNDNCTAIEASLLSL